MTTATEQVSQQMTGTPADLLKYQANLVRTGRFEPLGRMMKLSIGDSADYRPPQGDNFLQRFGRFMDFRRCMLPIALSLDNSQLLVTASLLRAQCPKCQTQFPSGGAGAHVCPQCLQSFATSPVADLPDVPDPLWTPADWTPEEVQGIVKPDAAKIHPPLIAQRLTDRCEQKNGGPALLEGTNFLVFQPVVRIAYQAETKGTLVAAAGLIACTAGAGGMQTAFLVDRATGEAHFFGGKFVISQRG